MTATKVHARLAVPSSQLGFRPPPADCHLRAMYVRGTWVIYVWSAAGDRSELLAWISDHGNLEPRGTEMERVLAVETDELPPAWEALFGRYEVQSIVVRRDGKAVVSLHSSREEIEDLVRFLGEEAEVERMTEVGEMSDQAEEDPLTETERDAVLAAYKAGYFDVPREIRLSDLAEQLDRSSGAMSTLLRRGLQRLVASYARDQLEGPPFPLGSRSEAEEDPETDGEPASPKEAIEGG